MSKIQQTQQTHAQPAAKANKSQQAHKPLNASAAQMLEAPETMRAEDVISAQQQVGNQVVQRALDKDARRKGLTDEQGNLQQEITSQIQQKRGGGSPLPETIQKEAAKKLGRSFKDVRIHTDESADSLSRTISARAFTIGKDIFFKNGVFAPGSSAGRETIIHELTHVVQQDGKGGASGALKLGSPNTAQEREADRMGKKHAAAVSAAPAGAVQRESEEEELQMQGEEEELLQAQPSEEEELQMQEDEEELQMQDDDDIAEDAPAESPDDLMMQEDEEELQMQPAEEDELQMQPDAGNVIQRKWEQDDKGNWKKVEEGAESTEKPKPGFIDTRKKIKKAMGGNDVSLPGDNRTQLNKSNVQKELLEKVGGKEKQITGKSMGGVFHAEARRKEKFEENFVQPVKNEKAKAEKTAKENTEKEKQEKVSNAKQKWMSTLKDPKASKEDIAKAKERLGAFHKDVGKKDFKAAKAERRTSLEDAAKSGDDDAYEKWQAERKKTKGEKAKDFFKSAGKKMGSGLLSAGKWAGGKALGFAKGKLNAGVDHFLGTKSDDKDDDKKDDAKPSVNIVNNMGGSGSSGGGGGGASEMIAELYQENKKLKEELAGLKKTA